VKRQRLYRVSYSRPSKTGYRMNGHCNIVTTDVARAVYLAKELYPDAEIWTVDHRGPIDHVDGALRGEGE